MIVSLLDDPIVDDPLSDNPSMIDAAVVHTGIPLVVITSVFSSITVVFTISSAAIVVANKSSKSDKSSDAVVLSCVVHVASKSKSGA